MLYTKPFVAGAVISVVMAGVALVGVKLASSKASVPTASTQAGTPLNKPSDDDGQPVLPTEQSPDLQALDDLRINADEEITGDVRKGMERMRADVRTLQARERTEAHHRSLQIPADDLRQMPTNDVVEAVLSTPLKVVMFFAEPPDGGLEVLTQKFNGAAELLRREDVADAILERYRTATGNIEERQDAASRRVFNFTVLELLMSSNRVLTKLDVEEKTQAIASVIHSHDLRGRYDAQQAEPVYGKASRPYRALPVAKMLDALGYEPYEAWKAEHPNVFESRFINYPESGEVLDIARQFVAENGPR